MNKRNKIRLGGLGVFILALAAGLVDYPPLAAGLPWPQFLAPPFRLGLDLQGGVQLIYSADLANIPSGEEASAMAGVRDVIERRVNVFGVTEPVVQTAKSGNQWRVIVELPGVNDVAAAVALINETPRLEFKEVAAAPATSTPPLDPAAVRQRAEEILSLANSPDADFAELAKQHSEDSSASNGGDLGWAKAGIFVPAFEEVCLRTGAAGAVYPKLVPSQFGFHIIQIVERRGAGDQLEAHCRHILFKTGRPPSGPSWVNTALSGTQLERAAVSFNSQTGEPQVVLQFNREGKKLFADITRRNLGRPVGIFLDGADISTPVVREQISGGSAVISGNFTIQEAKRLKERLNAGALPVPITIISQQTVGATLGREAVDKSLQAAIIGLVLVALYLILQYRLPGVIATASLVVYGVLLLAVFKLIHVTLSLAGLAGFILSLGMAVDANILIYERLKEELVAGHALARAIALSHRHAWPSIRDSNLSTLLTSLILMGFSTSVVKGFAITLTLGIFVNFFTALVVARLLLELTQPAKHPSRYLWLYGVPARAVRSLAVKT